MSEPPTLSDVLPVNNSVPMGDSDEVEVESVESLLRSGFTNPPFVDENTDAGDEERLSRAKLSWWRRPSPFWCAHITYNKPAVLIEQEQL